MDENKKTALEKTWKAIATKAVTDEEFKKKLVADPVGTMIENGLTLPEGTEMKIGTGKRQTIPLPNNAPDEIREEVKWWMWRLDSIREFGKEEPVKQAGTEAMSAQEEE